MNKKGELGLKLKGWRNNPLKFVDECFGVTPDKWQEEALRTLPDPKIVYLSLQAAVGPGKLLSDNTLVPTISGVKKHGDLKTGDTVFSQDGSITRVKAVIRWKNRPALRFTFSDGTKISCAEEHLWKVRSQFLNKFKDWRVVEAKEIRDSRPVVTRYSGEKVNRFHIPAQAPAQYHERSLALDPFLLGCWLGDGCRNSSCIVKDDADLFEEIIKRGYSVNKIKKSPSAGQRWWVKTLGKRLRELGIYENYSYQRFVPEMYKFGSIKQRTDILCGLLSTDGRVKTNGMMDFHSTSKRLIEDVAWLVRSLGGLVKGRKVDTHRKRPCYSLGVRLPFNPFYIKRKAVRWRKPPWYKLVRHITNIEKIPNMSGNCIEVGHSSGMYLADGFIPTHNSSLLAWAGLWFMLCQGEGGEHPKGACVAITRDNLKDNLWPEMAKWRGRSQFLLKNFTWTKERIYCNDHEETWFLSARSFSKNSTEDEQGRTLSGLHSKYILYLIDESGDISPSVLRAADQGLSNCTWGMIIQAGNPTSHKGMLYHAATKDSNRWYIIRINGDPDDPNRSPRINIEWARQQIAKYGRDNPWVMSSILGQFPPTSINALLSPEDVSTAMGRHLIDTQYEYSQKRLGIDPARFGDDRCFDDKTEILTDEGWKLFQDLKGSEKVLSIGVNDSKASWGDISHIHKAPFDGELNVLEKRHLNFAITDNHRMLVRSSPKSSRYMFKPYRDLPKDFVIRQTSGWCGVNNKYKTFCLIVPQPHGGVRIKNYKFDFLDWASFLGWFVSEGNVYVDKREPCRYRVLISQNPGEKMESIKRLLSRMGLKWRLASNGMQVEFHSSVIGKYLREHCGVGASNKVIPKEIKESSEESINTFLDSFLAGDGTCRKDGTGRVYVTSSPRLANDIQELLAKVGRAGLLRRKERKGSSFEIDGRKIIRLNDTFVIYERLTSKGKHTHKKDIKRVPYKGFVWCVATPKESIYVRRNGIPMWSGNTVLFPRQGLAALLPAEMRNADGPQIASRVVLAKERWNPESIFVDDTGGYGASAIDSMIQANISPIPVNFSSKADDPRYYNKRAEMYFRMSQWVKSGGALPQVQELIGELTAQTYTMHKGRLLLNDKERIKAELGRSPDYSDALALTFAHAEMPGRPQHAGIGPSTHVSDWDPFK